MLQKMRDQTQSLVFKVLVGIIIFVLAIFGFGAFNLFVTDDPDVASVGGEGISQSALAAEVERERRRLAAQLGEDFDPSLIDPVRLQEQVLEQLIARSLLTQAAEDLGMGASPSQVNRVLVSNPTFQIDGAFQPELYRQAVRSLGFTPQGFMDQTAELLVLQQLQSSLTETAFLTDAELNVNAELLGQRRDVAYLPFTVDRFREQVEVTDEEVKLRYEENQLEYTTEESVDVAYVTLSWEQLVEDPSIEISEDAVRGAYETERAAAPAEEERGSRHILLQTGDTRSPEQARAELEKIKQRVEAGEPFETLAKELSEDPGSASQGGDLGFAGRGVFDPAFEEALFALEAEGQVSDPVQTPFGYHLIQLSEIRQTEFPGFEEARADIDQRLRRSAAEELYIERLRNLDNLAFEQPDTLDGIVEGLDLELQTAQGVTREQGPPPFDDPQVRERLFSREVLDDGFNSAAVEYAPSRSLVMRVSERYQPEPIPLEQVAEDIRADIEGERARILAQEAQAAALSRLQAGEKVSDVAADSGGNWQTFERVGRTASQVPRTVLQTAFELPRPERGGKSVGEAALPGGGVALVTVTQVEDADVTALPDAELQGMRRFLADRAQRLEFGGLFNTLMEEASVRRPE